MRSMVSTLKHRKMQMLITPTWNHPGFESKLTILKTEVSWCGHPLFFQNFCTTFVNGGKDPEVVIPGEESADIWFLVRPHLGSAVQTWAFFWHCWHVDLGKAFSINSKCILGFKGLIWEQQRKVLFSLEERCKQREFVETFKLMEGVSNSKSSTRRWSKPKDWSTQTVAVRNVFNIGPVLRSQRLVPVESMLVFVFIG